MSPSRDERARRLAWVPIATGLLNSWCVAGLAWGALNHVGGFWGWLACGLVPFGVFELAAGLYARKGAAPARVLTFVCGVQLMAVALGACPSGLGAIYVLLRLRGR